MWTWISDRAVPEQGVLSSKYPQLQGASEFICVSSRFTARHIIALSWEQILAVLFARIVQVADAQLACNTKPEAGDKWSNSLRNRAIRHSSFHDHH